MKKEGLRVSKRRQNSILFRSFRIRSGDNFREKKKGALRNFEALRISSEKLFRRQERELTFDPISNFKDPDHSFSSTLYSSSWFGISRINWPGYVM